MLGGGGQGALAMRELLKQIDHSLVGVAREGQQRRGLTFRGLVAE